MFSFFRSSKKPSPAESPENSEASSLPPNVSDDYVMIEKRGQQPPDPYYSGGVYPSLGPAGGARPGASSVVLPNAADGLGRMGVQRQESEVTSYLQGVPFKLSPLIRLPGDADPMEVWGFEVDQILANMTRAVSLCEAED